MAVNPKQGTLDSFVKKTGGSPRAQRVQSGPIRHAAASKIVRHSPMSTAEGSGGHCQKFQWRDGHFRNARRSLVYAHMRRLRTYDVIK